jgi:hypothetical protein
LEVIANALGFHRLEIFEHAWFQEQLYRDDSWRLELLGITGRPSALSRVPIRNRPKVPGPLVGRQEELTLLRGLTGDAVLWGQPGVGKTALLEQLNEEEWGYFLVDGDPEALANAVRRLDPERIILDDAHFNPSLIGQLRQLREEIGAQFAIIATCWPARTTDVSGLLGTSQEIEIPLLSRDGIAEVVQSTGLRGPPELVQVIVDQAQGRAGLAATLAWLCLSGQVTEVARGDALLAETIGTYRNLLGDESALLLGVISLSGEHGIDEAKLQSILGVSRPRLFELLNGFAHGGTVGEVASYGSDEPRLVVQPEALRYAAVHGQFFQTPGTPYYWSIVKALPNPASALMPLIGATHRGAKVDRSRIEGLLREDRSEHALRAYASLGKAEAQFCLDLAPQYSQQIAEELLDFAPEIGLPILLQTAVGDSRPLHSSPDHSLRIIRDYVAIPHDSLRRRRTVLAAVKQWLAQGKDTDVAIIAAAAALGAGWDTHLPKPGSGNTIILSRGLVGIEELKGIARLWDETLVAFAGHEVNNLSPLIRALEDLCYPGRYLRTGPGRKWLDHAHKIAKCVIKRLADQYDDRPAVLHELRGLKGVVGARVRIPKHPEFDTLFPLEGAATRYDPEEHRRLEEQQVRAANRLASRWHKEPAEGVARRFVQLEREAATMEISWPRLSPTVAEKLACCTHSAAVFVRVLKEERAQGDLLAPFVNAVAKKRPSEWIELIDEVLRDQEYRPLGIMACLSEDVGSELRNRAVSLCDWRLNTWLEYSRVTLPEEILAELLRHDDETVVSAVVVRLGVNRTDELSDNLRPIWEQAVANHTGGEYWIATILSQNPELLVKWLRRYIDRSSSRPWQWEHFPDRVLEGVGALPLGIRIELLELLAQRNCPHVEEELVARLLGSDTATEQLVFRDERLQRYRRVLLHGVPDKKWLRRAVTAFHAGMEPEEIASSALWGFGGFSLTGRESGVHEEYLKAFRSLATRPLNCEERVIVEAGERVFLRARDRSRERERREAIYGR